MNRDLVEKIVSKYYLIIPILGFVIYLQILSFGFVNCDDHDLILNNTHLIDELGDIPNTFSMSYMDSQYYRPMVSISFIIDYQLAEQSPVIYHLTNILLHIITTLVLFLFMQRLKFDRVAAFFASIIFLVHPLFVNAVAWIPGRNDLLFGMFSLISFLTFVNYLKSSNNRCLIFHFLSFAFALFSKETAVVLPVLFLLYFFLNKSNYKSFKELMFPLISWGAVLVVWFILRSQAEFGTDFNDFGLSALAHNWVVPFEYLAKFFIPPLSSISVLSTFNSLNLILGIALSIIIITSYILIKNKISKMYIFGYIWFLLLIIPGMFVRRLNAEHWNDFLDCRAYLPMIGIIILILSIIPKSNWNEKIKRTSTFMIIISIYLFVITFISSMNYSDPYSFYSNAVESNPDRAQFQYQFAKACIAESKNDEAEEALRNAIKAQPNYAKNYYNLGAFLTNSKPDSAIKYLDKSIELDSTYKNAYDAKFTAILNLQQPSEAREFLLEIIDRFNSPQDIQKLIAFDIGNNSFSEIEKLCTDLGKQQQNTELANVIVNKAVDLFEGQKIEDAIKLLESSLHIDKTNAFAIQNLFQYYLIEKRNTQKSKHYYQLIIDNNIQISPELHEYYKQFILRN